jgi:hypothetical protein
MAAVIPLIISARVVYLNPKKWGKECIGLRLRMLEHAQCRWVGCGSYANSRVKREEVRRKSPFFLRLISFHFSGVTLPAECEVVCASGV